MEGILVLLKFLGLIFGAAFFFAFITAIGQHKQSGRTLMGETMASMLQFSLIFGVIAAALVALVKCN